MGRAHSFLMEYTVALGYFERAMALREGAMATNHPQTAVGQTTLSFLMLCCVVLCCVYSLHVFETNSVLVCDLRFARVSSTCNAVVS